jgi:hypothetical protein
MLKVEAYGTLVSVVWSFSLPWLSMKRAARYAYPYLCVCLLQTENSGERGRLCLWFRLARRDVAQRAGREHGFDDIAGGTS